MRLIDADALPVCKEHCIDECGFGANFYFVHKTDIDAAPTITIEAEPVKHGRWIKPTRINGRAFQIVHCSVCKEVPCGVDEHTKFCPNCGCKMDLEET